MDASLQADLWLFLGKSSKPPLLLSPPLAISRGFIPHSRIFRCEHIPVSPSPAGREPELELLGWLPCSWAMALLAGIPACQQCQEGQTPPQTRPRWPFPSARRVCPGSCWARATARCCHCYFLLVFLDIDTSSSLHPQDGFQASILFPMATKNPARKPQPTRPTLWQGGEVGEAPAPPGCSLQLDTKLFESKTLVIIKKQGRYRWGSPEFEVPRSVTRPQVSRGDTRRRMGFAEIPVAHPPQARFSQMLGWSTGLSQPAAPLLQQHPRDAAPRTHCS